MAPVVRVLIADDHPLMREGLTTLLRRAELEVVGEAATGEAAVEMVASCAADVVLLDLSLPGMDGPEATRRIRAKCPAIAIVILATLADRARVLEAVDAGASGYLLNDDDPAVLVAAIRAAAEGESPFSPRVAGVLVEARTQRRAEDQLTTREREVVELVAEGLSNKQIARRLGITEGTVKAHLGSAFRRIGVRRRTQAALWVQAHRQGGLPNHAS